MMSPLSCSLLKTNSLDRFCVNGELDFTLAWRRETETLKMWPNMESGQGLEKGRQDERREHVLWAEPNLACHPVGAILPKAQRGRYSAHYFVHVLIVNPAAGRGNTHH